MKGFGNGGSEFVGDSPGFQKGNALFDRGQVEGRDAYGFSVAGRAVFYIHGNIVQNAGIIKLLQMLRKTAVGIQLDLIAQYFQFFKEREHILLQQRFATRNADAVQAPFALLQKFQKLFLFNPTVCVTA